MTEPKPSRTERLHIRLTQAGRDSIDQVRGNWSRSEYVRRATARAVAQGFRGPNSGEDTL